MSQGIDIPEGFRAVPRTFEDPRQARTNGVQEPGVEPGMVDGVAPDESYDWSSWRDEDTSAEQRDLDPPEVIGAVIRLELERIIQFVSTPPFQALLEEMEKVPADDRPQFVLEVVLNADAIAKRGIVLPDGMQFQRSTFHDGRPTLFCVSCMTDLAYPWRKLTVTFDNQMIDG